MRRGAHALGARYDAAVDGARALALVKSKDFRRAVENFRRNAGIAPHPAVAYKILVQEATGEERITRGSWSGKRALFKKRKAAEESAPEARASKLRSQEEHPACLVAAV